MKAKRKIDQKAIQQFFIDHTEKFVIGVVSLLFAYFGYLAVMRSFEHYPKSTADLQQATDKANSAMQHGPADPGKAPAKIAVIQDYDNMIAKFKETVPSNDPNYVIAVLPFWKQYAPPKLRDTPEVYPAENLRAKPGRGALASNEGGTNGPGSKGQRWVAVTALVPFRRQLAEYHNKFDNSADESNMVPKYFGFLVQRAEVTPGAKGEPNWDKTRVLCNEGSFAVQMGKWTGVSPEVVDPRNTDPALTSSLPPLTNGEWNEDVAHPSEIKLAPPPPAQNNGAPPVPNVMQRGRPIIGAGDRLPMPGRDLGATGLPGRIGGGPPAANADNGLGGLVDQPKVQAAQPKAADEVPEYLLLRYFDFDVEADKQYAYRAFVILENPNYNLPANVLEEAELAKRPYLGIVPNSHVLDKDRHLIWIETDQHYAKWSSYCVSEKMPADMRLLAGDTTPPKPLPGPQEPNGEVRVLLWGEKSGLNLNFHKADLFRGANLSFPKAKMKPLGTEIDPLDTKCILVDLAGGDPIVPKDRDRNPVNLSPGAMIVLDEMGNLAIHDEMGEGKEWAENTKEPERHGADRPPGGIGRRPGIIPQGSQGPDGPDSLDTRRRGGRGK